jgi:hypothetical protein
MLAFCGMNEKPMECMTTETTLIYAFFGIASEPNQETASLAAGIDVII